jgi:hypothetical protein
MPAGDGRGAGRPELFPADDAWQPIGLPDPPAGQGFVYKVPGSVMQAPVIVSFHLANAAAAGNRIPAVTYLDGLGVPLGVFAAPFALQTGAAGQFTFGVGMQQFGAVNAAAIGAPLAPAVLKAGMTVTVTVAAMNAADQISGVRVYVQQLDQRPDGSN